MAWLPIVMPDMARRARAGSGDGRGQQVAEQGVGAGQLRLWKARTHAVEEAAGPARERRAAAGRREAAGTRAACAHGVDRRLRSDELGPADRVRGDLGAGDGAVDDLRGADRA